MPFHVEISNGMNHARVFNLSPAEVRERVIVPFLAGVEVELGDHRWPPAQCDLVILEGPEMATVDMSFGQGWSNAQRKARDVTRAALDTVRTSLVPIGTAVLASEAQDESYVGAALQRVGREVVAWSMVRDRLLTGVRDDVLVVIAVGDEVPTADWWFDVGLAVGGLGEQTLVVRTAAAPVPAALAGRASLSLDEGDDAFGAALMALSAAGAHAGSARARTA